METLRLEKYRCGTSQCLRFAMLTPLLFPGSRKQFIALGVHRQESPYADGDNYF